VLGKGASWEASLRSRGRDFNWGDVLFWAHHRKEGGGDGKKGNRVAQPGQNQKIEFSDSHGKESALVRE